jgi:small subunit ribosomal protein S14
MAKTSSIEKNKRRRKMTDKYKAKRAALKEIIYDRNKPMDERFTAQMKLTELPRNSSKTRIRNRCELTGRSRGFYRKLKLCRNQLRELASQGLIPGMTKSSW